MENERTIEDVDLIISVGSDFAYKEARRINAASADLLADTERIRERLTDIEKSLPQDLDATENPAA